MTHPSTERMDEQRARVMDIIHKHSPMIYDDDEQALVEEILEWLTQVRAIEAVDKGEEKV